MGAARGRDAAGAEPADDAEDELSPLDGRHARRDRNRVAVLDAALALFHEGDPRPRPEQVAERAGVSLRSLYRYFADTTELYLAAMERNFDRAATLALIAGLGTGPLEVRIERCAQGRLALYEALAPTIRMARVASVQNELVRARWAYGRQLLRRQVEVHFAPELGALPSGRHAAVAAAIDVLCQLETLDYLREQRGFSVEETIEVVVVGLAALLNP